MPLPRRAEAWDLLTEWTQSDSLRKHGLAVEAAMRAYARRFWRDEELWGITGLIHDLDFERYPNMDDPVNGHPRTAIRVFRERDYPCGTDTGGYGPCALFGRATHDATRCSPLCCR